MLELFVYHVQITKHFTGINSFNSDKSDEIGILSFTFYENWGTERLSHLSKLTRIRTQAVKV